MSRASSYKPPDVALLRAAKQQHIHVPPWPSLDSATVERWCEWLTEVWAQPDLAASIRTASPALAGRVDAVCAGRRPLAEQARRMALAVARYVVRAVGRATPFGSFAGVAVADFGAAAVSRTGDDRATRRADAAWLAAVIARLEGCTAVRRRLLVAVNNFAVVRGDRLVVGWQPHTGSGTTGEVSVRHSPAVRTVLHTAETPVPIVDLIEKLAAEFPEASADAFDAMMTQLIKAGVLVTDLRAPSTSPNGLVHAVDRLIAMAAGVDPETAALIGELHSVAAAVTNYRADEEGISARMRLLSNTVQPLVVDLRIGMAVTLPLAVAREATAAGAALVRLSPASFGHPAWREYHANFLDRYGPNALVPVRHLTDPTVGLGFPHHFAASTTACGMSLRDERLLNLAQQAAFDGVEEVLLDEAAVTSLAADGPTYGAVPHVDVCGDVRAPNLAALAGGAFTFGVSGIGRSAAMTGRFLDVLPEKDRQRLADAYGRMPARIDGAIVAQLSFPPQQPRMENTQRAPRLIPHLIALGEHRDDGDVLALTDLAVTADARRLWLVSLSRRKPIETILPHGAARHTMPPLGRFLLELPRAGCPAVASFDWGTAACLPFLPRVRYGRAVLAPARWRITPDALPGTDAPEPAWVAAWSALAARLRLPSTVSVGNGDRQLRLDTTNPMHLAILRDHLRAADRAVVMTEATTPVDHGWLGGRAHEVVIPLTATTPPVQPPAFLSRRSPLRLAGMDDGRLPGSSVLYARLHGEPGLADAILTDHLPEWLTVPEDEGQAPVWWFVRYRHPTPHLRLRLRTHAYGREAERLGAWAAELRHHGLIHRMVLDTDRPEFGRYGHGTAMETAEDLFAADSAAAIAQLHVPPARRRAVTAASLVDLASAVMGRPGAGLLWLLDHRDFAGRDAADRDVVRDARALALPHGAALGELPGGAAVAAAWGRRREAAANYVRQLAADDSHINPETVLGSLLHLHYVRVHGIAPDHETATYRIARAVALAADARRGQRP